ncbi:hypothetical protein Cs7R123_51540 [Catellatospora sp. TT07R-123]|uniref:hypothetical protein n=1 Tax=Catellatospora sp. TT07R-123 TaxID=2733863 RepID=UPI001B0A5AB6|nr:hypothetical protein [Catellatospora sp. TT07R-123]GHJ47812.1 hypothetical protein Cs7R123_51540 [Catellatospora sp. TT07R-123]
MALSDTTTRPAPAEAPHPTSLFVNGYVPRRRGLVVTIGLLLGFVLTVVWSAEFVDSTIGDNVANTLLGHDAKGTPIAGIAAGIAFAFVSGIAGTFTACNIAVVGAMSPMLGDNGSRSSRVRQLLRPLGWLSLGMITVSALYGALVGIIGTDMPQFSTAPSTPGALSARSIQSLVVFGLIGLVMVYLGLAALRLVPDPFARIAQRRPNAPMVFMGVLIGGFLIGRPFGLFRMLFRDAADSGNPLYGAAAFVLQSLGNVVIMTVLLALISLLFGGGVQRWLAARPARMTVIVAIAFLAAGAFTFLYWDVRALERRGIIPWYPTAPWA